MSLPIETDEGSTSLAGTAQLPNAPISILTDDGPFFRLLAPGFQSDDIQIPSLPPTSAGTCFWLNEKVLLTALSVVDAMRDTSANYEFCAYPLRSIHPWENLTISLSATHRQGDHSAPRRTNR